jgi:NAD(P)-dependent dehydrogenase (short-subunit alcohol dehydrogenase family)
MSADLRDKVAIVTGGASGLGRAACLALAQEGVEVMVVDVDEPGGQAVASEVGGAYFAADVSSLEQNEAMVAATESRFGGVDFAYLNAGLASHCGVGEDFDLERYRLVMGVNLDGVVFGTHAVLPALSRRGGGAIVATASLAGLTGMPMDPLYAANKHAVVGLARSLGPALLSQNVRFNAVCPGFSESRLTEPLREAIGELYGVPLMPAEKVAGAVLMLLGGEMTGEAWFVQSGREPAPFAFRHIPGPRPEPSSAAGDRAAEPEQPQ